MDVTPGQCDRGHNSSQSARKVADGTYTRVWAWMTDKCRKKMNGGVEYITKEISQKEEAQEKERGL